MSVSINISIKIVLFRQKMLPTAKLISFRQLCSHIQLQAVKDSLYFPFSFSLSFTLLFTFGNREKMVWRKKDRWRHGYQMKINKVSGHRKTRKKRENISICSDKKGHRKDRNVQKKTDKISFSIFRHMQTYPSLKAFHSNIFVSRIFFQRGKLCDTFSLSLWVVLVNKTLKVLKHLAILTSFPPFACEKFC